MESIPTFILALFGAVTGFINSAIIAHRHFVTEKSQLKVVAGVVPFRKHNQPADLVLFEIVNTGQKPVSVRGYI